MEQPRFSQEQQRVEQEKRRLEEARVRVDAQRVISPTSLAARKMESDLKVLKNPSR